MRRLDLAFGALLALAAACWSWHGSGRVPATLSTARNSVVHSVWFEADAAGRFVNMSNRQGSHVDATTVHPVFPLAAYSAVMGLRAAFRLEPWPAVRVLLALAAAVWLGLLYAVLRLTGCRPGDAALLGFVAACSASFVFWAVIPETWVFGSATILFAVALAAAGLRRAVPWGWHLAGVVATLGVTITNGLAGLLAACAAMRWRRAAGVALAGVGIVLAGSALQRAVFPRSSLVLQDPAKVAFFFDPDAEGPGQILTAFVFHAMSMPAIEARDRYGRPDWPVLTVQRAAAGSGSRLGAAACWLWAGLLAVGAWAGWVAQPRRWLAVLWLLIAGQAALHLVYGDETFLYSLHWLPLLVLVVSAGTLTRARPFVLGLAAALLVCAGGNNVAQFRVATGLVEGWAAAGSRSP